MRSQHILEREKIGFAKVTPPCPYFGTCGGCALQDLSYADQLALKRDRLQRTLAALGPVPAVDVQGLEDPWRYRNKAEFTFGQSQGTLLLGYHALGSFWRIVDLEDCLLLPEPVMRALRSVHRLAASTGLPAYHPRTHQGFFRYVLVRHSRATGQMLFCLITAPGPREVVEAIGAQLVREHPAITSFYWGVTSRVADVAVPEELSLLAGRPQLEDRLGPFRIQLAPLSFLQPNSVQADRIYTRLAEALRVAPGGIAWDLYCGLGLVGFYLASQFRTVYGIDVEPRHVELAALNAKANGLSNIEFRIGRVETLLLDRRFWLQEAKPDVIVVDPPRAGLHPQALSSLLAARPPYLAYLSCNAQSLVRDLKELLAGFPRYRLAELQACDMFPQTNHLEILAILQRV